MHQVNLQNGNAKETSVISGLGLSTSMDFTFQGLVLSMPRVDNGGPPFATTRNRQAYIYYLIYWVKYTMHSYALPEVSLCTIYFQLYQSNPSFFRLTVNAVLPPLNLT